MENRILGIGYRKSRRIETTMLTQNDLKFIKPPSSAIALNEIHVEQYLPKEGVLTILSARGAEPHYVHGNNFRVQIGKKHAGRHKIAVLTAAETLTVKHKKAELSLQPGVYYVALANGSMDVPLVQ